MWVGKCCTGRENSKNNWGKVQNCPQNIHNLKKLQWIIKKFQEKNPQKQKMQRTLRKKSSVETKKKARKNSKIKK